MSVSNEMLGHVPDWKWRDREHVRVCLCACGGTLSRGKHETITNVVVRHNRTRLHRSWEAGRERA